VFGEKYHIGQICKFVVHYAMSLFDNGLLVVLIQSTYNDIDMKKLCMYGVLSVRLKVWKRHICKSSNL